MNFNSRWKLQSLKLRSRRLALWDGFFYASTVGCSETYFSAFAVFLGANNFQLAVLSALPQFIAAISQLWTVTLLKKLASRKKTVLLGVTIQSFTLLPMLATYYLAPFRLDTFIFLVCLYFASNAFISPAWNSWMSDLVDAPIRGRYFGTRNRIITLTNYLSMTGAGFLLRKFQVSEHMFWGFALIFGVATFSRWGSVFTLSKKFDPPGTFIPAARESFPHFVRTLLLKPYGPLMLYAITVNFSVYMSAAYFTPYMLKTLSWNFTTYTLVIGGVSLSRFLSNPIWGKLVDQMGAKNIVVFTGILISFVTLPWVFTTTPLFIFFAQCFAGFAWSGWELSVFTLAMETIPNERRAQDMSYQNILNGSAMLLGGVIGSLIVDYGPHLFHAFAFVMAFSGLCRLAFIFGFASRINNMPILRTIRSHSLVLGASMFRSALGGLQFRPIIFPKKK